MSDSQAPGNPSVVTLRPLSQGIKQDVSPSLVPKGAFHLLEELIPEVEGLRRRGGIVAALNDLTIEDPPIRKFFTFWLANGGQQGIALGGKFLWKVALDETTRYTWDYDRVAPDDVTIVSGLATFTNGAAGAPTNLDLGDEQVTVGDILEVNTVEYVITEVDDTNHQVTLDSSASVGVSTAFSILRGFAPASENYYIDYALGTNALVIVDGFHYPFIWDGTTIEPFTMDDPFSAGAVAFAQDRFWFGDIGENSEYARQMIKWTEVLTVAAWQNVPTTNYVSLPYTNSRILRITLLGEMLLVFFADLIFYGSASSDPNLPVRFRRIDSAGVGLAGKDALASAEDAVYFVGPENIWAFGVGNVLGRIGDPILPIFQKYRDQLKTSYMALDTKNSLVLIGVPGTTGGELEKVLVFNSVTKAWSTFNMNFEAIHTVGLTNEITMDELGEEYDTGTVSGTSGTPTLVGVGTSWLANVEVGWKFEHGTGAGGFTYAGNTYEVQSVNTDTGITLTTNLLESPSGASYMIFKPMDMLEGKVAEYRYEGEGRKGLYFWRREMDGVTSGLYRMFDELEEDDNYVVLSYIETGDMDFEFPDRVKTITYFRIKLKNPTTEALSFIISASENQGRTWRRMGALSIPVNRNEGKVDFRVSGSALRFRVQEEGGTEPYTITEMTLFAKPRGMEGRFF